LVAAQTSPIAHGTVHLVAQESTLEAGREAWVGVLFDLDKGWHIYWVNPGDAGEPPTIQWNLPPGFRAGSIRWPRPLRLKTGPLIDYGYQGRTLLPVPMQVPSGYQAGTRVTLAADVRYVVCREVCIPARAHITLTLPSDADAADASAGRELFTRTRESSPRPMPASWSVQATQADDRIVLIVHTGTPESEAVFFPIDRDQIDNAAPQLVTPMKGDGVRIALRRSVLAEKPLSVLKGVVVLGRDRAFEIVAPVSGRR
jgi:thiol:disulfide interchange protein DsbD